MSQPFFRVKINELEDGEEFQTPGEEQCSTCPSVQPWEPCINGIQVRYWYHHSEATGYECGRFTEERSCAVESTPTTPIGRFFQNSSVGVRVDRSDFVFFPKVSTDPALLFKYFKPLVYLVSGECGTE